MNRCCICALMGLAGLTTLTMGCQAPAEPAGPTIERVSARSQDDQQELFEAVCDTLRAKDFRLDRQDRVNGVITTHPETTAQAFELWRPQPQPAYYWLESNLQTIRQQVTVQLGPDPQDTDRDGQQRIEVKVERFRYRLPERQIDNPAGALRVFSDATPTQAGQMERPSKTGYWVPLGRDETMERSLLAGIVQRYERPAPVEE